MAADDGYVIVTSFGVYDEGGGTRGDQNVYLHLEEHSDSVHSYFPHSVPMPGYGEEAWITATNKVVRIGRACSSQGGWMKGGGGVETEAGMESIMGTGTRRNLQSLVIL